jgi:predicted transcriptional regulator
MAYTDAQIQDELNRSMPAATRARLGDVIYNLINQHNALLVHLDTANVTGIGNANAATYSVTLPAERTYSPDV